MESIRNIPMMGGYLFYYKERIFGGIYGAGTFMVKITEASRRYLPDSIPQPPYEGAKDMLEVTILEDREAFQSMVVEMYDELPERKIRVSSGKKRKKRG
ncbi:MAG: transcriptional regulator [Lachnospiraceae bacterium]|nr:transcriptional regulator [Lachnospiraceae bacterium]